MIRQLLTLCVLLSCQGASHAGGESIGTRLDRLMDVKAQAELARQERALSEELGHTAVQPLPTIVSIVGKAGALTAHLLMPNGTQRSFAVGDRVADGWSVVFIEPTEVLVGKTDSKPKPMKLISLNFATRDAQGGLSAQAGTPVPPTPAIPPLPAPVVVSTQPAPAK